MKKVVSVEWLATKHSMERTTADKVSLSDLRNAEVTVMISLQKSLGEVCKKCTEETIIVAQKSDVVFAVMLETDAVVVGDTQLPHAMTPVEMHLRWAEDVVHGHEVTFEDLSAKLEVSSRLLTECERKSEFYEDCHGMLVKRMESLTKFGVGIPLFPHPAPYPTRVGRPPFFELLVLHYEKCLLGFEFNDILVCSCRYLYHPFYAMTHFRTINVCASPDCRKIIAPEWAKSMGFREFDTEMLEKEECEGTKSARLQYLAHCRDGALSLCPNVGEFLRIPPTYLGVTCTYNACT
jgi:desulfoferrodoxin (superoxide reductase-like protein)